MQKVFKILTLAFLVLALSNAAFATNGDNLMAIGPIARSMGGVGIAAPQDAISAVFANPAAMCFAPYCPAAETNFAFTAFMPHVDAKVELGAFTLPLNNDIRINLPAQTFEADSHFKVYPIPAIGISYPITKGAPFWRFGLSAFGVSGLGVDYRDTNLDRPGHFFGQAPLIAGEFTQLSILKIAPSIACQPFEKLSVGVALHVDYGDLDLRSGSSTNFGIGAQLGMIYKLTDEFSLGLTYVTPQNINHDRVADFDGDGGLDRLKLESPQWLGLGLAYNTLNKRLLLEANVKWINWSGANGYGDFDWKDQYVVALGVQYKPTSKLALRAGYNFGNNPVSTHHDFVGVPVLPGGVTKLQGQTIPTYFFETFRIIGFPAVVEHHVTAGVGYEFTPRIAASIGYTHAFANTIRESGTNLIGQPTTLESTLSEDSLDLSFTWRF